MKKKSLFCTVLVMALLTLHGNLAFATERLFSEIAVDLPTAWDGEERIAFITGNRDEYLVSMGKKNEAGDAYLAQVTLYILPNTQGISAEDSAVQLATKQDDTSKPVQEGQFWKFSGYPQSNIIKGLTVTRVAATKEWWCIIMSQDTPDQEAEKLITSLRGITERAKILLAK